MPEFDSTIEYRDIAGYQGYAIGSDGSVWSKRRMGPQHLGFGEWHPVRTYRRPNKGRYTVVHLQANPGVKRISHLVHRLVLEAFVGPCPEGMEGRHFPDRDTGNNSIRNLSWATHRQNMLDRMAQGTARCKSHCRNGHEFTKENTFIQPRTGYRTCRICQRVTSNRCYARNGKRRK